MAATQKGLERSEPDNPRTRPANWKQSGGWTRPAGRAAPEQLPQALAWPDLSQLADKFYIVLMVFLIDQHLMLTAGNSSLADVPPLSAWTSPPAPR